MFIPPAIRDQLLERAKLEDVIREFQTLQKKGSSLVGTCPSCRVENALKVSVAKEIAKCFKCGQGGRGAISYLQDMQGMKYVDACVWLANFLNIDISAEEEYVHPEAMSTTVRPKHSTEFRDSQLAESGITEEAQTYTVKSTNKKGEEVIEKLSRYTAGSIDFKGQPTTGHDMLLHYLDLDGQPITYRPSANRKEIPYIRIRHASPELHLDKAGKPIRYLSPKGGGNHLWIPEYIRQAFAEHRQLETLVFIEGEKKADALCLAGIPAVGIAGIHNFAYSNEMPSQIERLLRGCGVSRPVFWLDADYQDLGTITSKQADQRPKLFAKAAIRFRWYFEKYQQRDGINTQIYMVAGTDKKYKGADDLLLSLKNKKNLAKDLDKALNAHDGQGKLVHAVQLNQKTDYQIYELWNCHSPKAFMAHYKDDLKDIGEFRIKKIRYTYDPDTEQFVLCQKILPFEQFWIEHANDDGPPRLEFDHYGITRFLANRGFARFRMDNGEKILIHVEDNIVTQVDMDDIYTYVLDFTKGLENVDLLRMLMRGGNAYLSEDKKKNLDYEHPSFIQPLRDRQVLCFKDVFWVVTPNDIKEYKHKDLPGHLWKEDIIDFSPTLVDNFLSLSPSKEPPGPNGEKKPPEIECQSPESDIFRYIFATSDIHWRNQRKTPTTFPAEEELWTEEDFKRYDVLMASMADKIIATGKVMSRYMDSSNTKAIICVDAFESEVGKNEGGTGKSIWSTMFEHILPTVVIDATAPDLTRDQFLYEEVDTRTHTVVLDDCRPSLDFHAFLSHITRGSVVNKKGIGKKFQGRKQFIFNSNHTIKGESKSYMRRQYTIGFSDFFDPDRTPRKEFKHNMFEEWEHDQWNAWYNFMAHCLQIYMQVGLVSFAPDEDIRRRKDRQIIGESLLEFLENYFYEGSTFMNTRLTLVNALDAFHKQYPDQRKYVTRKHFRDKLKVFARYAGYEYNLPATGKDKRIRNSRQNIEYFILSDSSFDLNQYELKVKTQEFDFDAEPSF